MKPEKDEARTEGVNEYVCDEEGCAMREEMLAEFHGNSIAGGEGNHGGGVSKAWEFPVIGRVGECVRDGGLSGECRQREG